MATRRLPLPDALVLAAKRYTQRELAERLGVHPRTLRKWKHGDNVPTAEHARAIGRVAAEESRRIKAAMQRDHARHPKGLPPAELPPVEVSRQLLKRYRFHADTGRLEDAGERYESHWANYDVRGWSIKAIHALLARAWKLGAGAVQFILRVPPGTFLTVSDGMPVSRGATGGMRRVQKWTRTATPPINLRGAPDEAALLDLLLRFIPQVRAPGARAPEMLYLAVDDNSIKGTPKRAKGSKVKRKSPARRKAPGKSKPAKKATRRRK